MPYTIVYTDGNHVLRATFETREIGHEWQNDVSRIKAHNRELCRSGGRDRAGMRRWVQSVLELRERWTDRLVPLDLRRACNSFEEGLKMPVTVWND